MHPYLQLFLETGDDYLVCTVFPLVSLFLRHPLGFLRFHLLSQLCTLSSCAIQLGQLIVARCRRVIVEHTWVLFVGSNIIGRFLLQQFGATGVLKQHYGWISACTSNEEP